MEPNSKEIFLSRFSQESCARNLKLNKVKSGIFLNETDIGDMCDSDNRYTTYNPRLLQEQVEALNIKRYQILKDKGQCYIWNPFVDPIEKLKCEERRRQLRCGAEEDEDTSPSATKISCLYRRPAELSGDREDCIHFQPRIFPIPCDLQKTFLFTVEMVFGDGAIKPLKPEKVAKNYNRPKEIACIFSAYVITFIKNPDIWDVNTLGMILCEGLELFKRSECCDFWNPNSDFNIIPELPDMDATIDLKLHFTGNFHGEPNILKTLSLFFNKFNAAIITSVNLYLLIWKRCKDSFYIYDPNGRNCHCERDFKDGNCSLIATYPVEHVVHLILSYSAVRRCDEYNLYEIRLVNFGRIACPVKCIQRQHVHKRFAVVNRFYALVPAVCAGLTPPKTGKEANSSLMTAFLTLLYSRMDPPRFWGVQMVEDLICYGCYYYSLFLKDRCISGEVLNIVDFPQSFIIGTYRAVVKKVPFLYAGHVADCRSYRESQLTQVLKDFFCCKGTAIILQVDNSSLAIWRDQFFYYCLDCFQRGRAGQVLECPNDRGVGCLQIHTMLDSLCRIIFKNSLKMRKGGKFFMHSIEVESIGPFAPTQDALQPASFGKLFIQYPLDCHRKEKEEEFCNADDLDDTEIFGSDLPGCLSRLSTRPCERVCDELEFERYQEAQRKRKERADKVKQAVSIQSIPMEERIPEYDNIDIIDEVIAEIVCDVVSYVQPRKRIKKKSDIKITASNVLLLSDKEQLEAMKVRVKRGQDYDNFYERYKTKQRKIISITLEEELALPHNFISLPDGSWAIFTKSQIKYSCEADIQLAACLACITATALTGKYLISSWNSELVEYPLTCVNVLCETLTTFDETVKMVTEKRLPCIQIGSSKYRLIVHCVLTNKHEMPPLRETLDKVLEINNRVIVLCKEICCLIVRRLNFFYLYLGYPCDAVGFRSFCTGPACLIRFMEMGAMMRRIEMGCTNRGCCANCKYVIAGINVYECPKKPCEPLIADLRPSRETMIWKKMKDEVTKQKLSNQAKMAFLDDELRKENCRIYRFLKMKSYIEAKKCGVKPPKVPLPICEPKDEECKEPPILHKPGKRLLPSKATCVCDRKKQQTQLILGYRFRKTCYFKVQGSISVGAPKACAFTQIQPSYFASVLAVLYAILRPVARWDTRRIDVLIGRAMEIFQTVTDPRTKLQRIIRHIIVDEFMFDVTTRIFNPLTVWGPSNAMKIEKATLNRRYFLLKIETGTFALYKDDYYHLFDPHTPSAIKAKGECPTCFDVYPETKGASWILFPDAKALLRYLYSHLQGTSQDQPQLEIHIVDVISFRKVPPKIHMLSLLTTEENICYPKPQPDTCVSVEEPKWLIVEPDIVVWSRFNRTNTDAKPRGHPLAKDKEYDIEIPGCLWSLWGTLHPESMVFSEFSRGKQFLACNILACCAADSYDLRDWNPRLLDHIVIFGDIYLNESFKNFKCKDYEVQAEQLRTECALDNLLFRVHIEYVIYGTLYSTLQEETNLASALKLFFTKHRYGLLQCFNRHLAFGETKSGDYFMFECQSKGPPLFPKDQGAAYVLRMNRLQTLLYCIIVTLKVPYYHEKFSIHKVEMSLDKAAEEEECDLDFEGEME